MASSKTTRVNISPKLRFEVLKRDLFTCKYCGAKAPDVLLHVDHIKPVSKGGNNDILNLVTACAKCNIGKSNRELSDRTIIDKQRRMLDELQERKEQLDMLIEWQLELSKSDDKVSAEISKFWKKLTKSKGFSNNQKKDLTKLIAKFNVNVIMESMKNSANQYLEYDENDVLLIESVDKAWNMISRICSMKQTEQEKPYMKDIFYITKTLENRLNYINKREAIKLLQECIRLKIDIEFLKQHAKEVNSWTNWIKDIYTFMHKNTSYYEKQ